MPLYPFKYMLETALQNNFAVGYFQAWNQDSLEAVLEAGEETGSPLIIGFGGTPVNQEWFNQWGLPYYAAIGQAAVKKSRIPLSFILNETETYEQCLRGIDLGFNVVMINSSSLAYVKNLEINKKLVSIAHKNDVAVEAELGHLPFGSADAESSRTDPAEAGEFIKETGIDALSVSIGNVHMLIEGEARIDLDLLKRIRDAAKVPLVIHGGTGFPGDVVEQSIELGVAKFNVGTILKKVYYKGLKDMITGINDNSDMQSVVGSRDDEDFTAEGKKLVKEKVIELLRLYNSYGKAKLYS